MNCVGYDKLLFHGCDQHSHMTEEPSSRWITGTEMVVFKGGILISNCPYNKMTVPYCIIHWIRSDLRIICYYITVNQYTTVPCCMHLLCDPLVSQELFSTLYLHPGIHEQIHGTSQVYKHRKYTGPQAANLLGSPELNKGYEVHHFRDIKNRNMERFICFHSERAQQVSLNQCTVFQPENGTSLTL